MPAALPVALLLLAEGTSYGPEPPAAPKAAAKPATDDGCATQTASANSRDIVICAQRPNGYRLNPDVMEARKERRAVQAGRLKTPAERAAVDSCSVGPQGCAGVFNVLGAAFAAAAMAKRLAEGKEIGSMFETTPQDDEYHLYLAAKQRRQQREAEAAALAAAAKAKAAQAATTAPVAKP